MGVCLGMQLLFEQSFEGDARAGFSFCPVISFLHGEGPHMNRTPGIPEMLAGSKDLPKEPYVYFVHSYHKAPADTPDVIATADYGEPVPYQRPGQRPWLSVHPERAARRQQLLKNVVDYMKLEEMRP